MVYDVEDPCFEFLSGTWSLAYPTGRMNSFAYEISGPGTGTSQGRWIVEGLPSGTYTVETYNVMDDYAADAHYQVIHAGGVTDVQVNTNNVATGWISLGSYDCSGTCVVNVSDYWTGAGTKLYVDALRFTLTSTLPAPPASAVPPHIGICIDDAGNANPTDPSSPIYTQLRLPFPLTFAVMPYQSYTNETANEVYTRGSEVILHQPMGYVANPNPGGSGWIRDNMTLDQVRTTVSTNLDNLPHIVGMNNHTGSLVTQQTDKMTVCMEELKARGLFFYDSRTITTSVAYDVAMDKGLLTAERDLFIDGGTPEETMDKIRSLAVAALYAPELPMLAIGHVRPDTAAGMQQIAPELEAMGVEVWPISRCIAQVIEADRQPAGASFQTIGAWDTVTTDSYSKLLQHQASVRLLDPDSTRTDEAIFTPSLQFDGDYDVYAIWPADTLNSPEIRARVATSWGPQTVAIDQSVGDGTWQYLGRFPCSAGSSATLTLDDTNAVTAGRIFRADAVRFVLVGAQSPASVQGWLLY